MQVSFLSVFKTTPYFCALVTTTQPFYFTFISNNTSPLFTTMLNFVLSSLLISHQRHTDKEISLYTHILLKQTATVIYYMYILDVPARFSFPTTLDLNISSIVSEVACLETSTMETQRKKQRLNTTTFTSGPIHTHVIPVRSPSYPCPLTTHAS